MKLTNPARLRLFSVCLMLAALSLLYVGLLADSELTLDIAWWSFAPAAILFIVADEIALRAR